MLSIFIKLPFVIKIHVLSIFEWPFYTGFTVCEKEEICSEISVQTREKCAIAAKVGEPFILVAIFAAILESLHQK